jgi:beta-lactamase class A
MKLLCALVDGSILSSTSSALLLDILSKTRTFPDRLKAGVPVDWRLAHKTGTSDTLNGVTDASHDVGVLTAPDGGKMVVVVLIGKTRALSQVHAAMTADVARAVIASYH